MSHFLISFFHSHVDIKNLKIVWKVVKKELCWWLKNLVYPHGIKEYEEISHNDTVIDNMFASINKFLLSVCSSTVFLTLEDFYMFVFFSHRLPNRHHLAWWISGSKPKIFFLFSHLLYLIFFFLHIPFHTHTQSNVIRRRERMVVSSFSKLRLKNDD